MGYNIYYMKNMECYIHYLSLRSKISTLETLILYGHIRGRNLKVIAKRL